MLSDIVLDDDSVTIVGDTVTISGDAKIAVLVGNAGTAIICRATDLILEHGPFRRPGSNPDVPRRALVHDRKDGLTLNWQGSYPGGVTIEGDVRMPKKLIVRDTILVGRKAFTPPREDPATGSLRASAPIGAASAMLATAADPSVAASELGLASQDADSFEMVDLLGEVLTMRQAIADLRAEVDRLKATGT